MAKYSRGSQKEVGDAMHEMKRGRLKSGSGAKVKNPKQAIAIGLSEAREKGEKVPAKKSAGKAAKKSNKGRRPSGNKSNKGRKPAKKSNKGRKPAKKSAGRPAKKSSNKGRRPASGSSNKGRNSAKKSNKGRKPAKKGR
jgi:hypothetical protein